MRLELAVDRIEGDRVVLIDQDQNVFVWPKKVLSKNIAEGQVIFLEMKDAQENNSDESNETAKDILNEILTLDE
jgi:hypothetical protein